MGIENFKLKPLKFEEAIEFFSDKVVIKPSEYEKLTGEIKNLAFSISGIQNLNVLNDVYRLIDKSMNDGTLLADFKKEFIESFQKNQLVPLAPYKIETIYRNNLFSSFNAGRYRQQMNLIHVRPYGMYDALMDAKTRPAHKGLNGIIKPLDDPFWDQHYPPNGHRCRCGVRSLSKREMESRGLKVSNFKSINPPDKGWDNNPGKARWEPDLEKYPKALQKAWKKRKKQEYKQMSVSQSKSQDS